MKIIYCSDDTYPSISANTVHLMKMCHSMANAGHIVTLIFCVRDNASINVGDVFAYFGIDENFSIIGFHRPSFRGGAAVYAYRALKLIKREMPDIVYGSSLLSCAFTAISGAAPVIFESHEEITGSNRAFNRFILKRLFKMMITRPAFIKLDVLTETLKEHFTNKYPILQKKIYVAPEAADTPHVTPPYDVLLEKRNGCSLNVGYTGHLYEGRGIDVIIETARLCPEMCFHIVGGNDTKLKYWKQQGAEVSNVIFYGHVPHAVIAQYGLQFDILLAPYQEIVYVGTDVKTASHTENWMSPLKIFEYMSYRKPIICSDIPVLHEVLTHDYNCIFCPPSDAEAWATALRRLGEDPEFAARISANAYNDFINEHTWDMRAKKVLDLSEYYDKN